MLKQVSYRFNEVMDRWLQEQAKIKGISKNDVLRELIAEKMGIKKER